MIRTCLLVAFVVAGCGATTPPSATGVVVVEITGGAEVASPPLPRPDIPLRVQWFGVSSSQGCFFFSGPETLGRDDHLGARASYREDGQSAHLRFDGAVVFDGYMGTIPFTLVRTSVHEYSGRWSVRETFALERLPNGVLRGGYHYDELGPTGDATGHCHIAASVLMTPS